jgi:hypothetical protein
MSGLNLASIRRAFTGGLTPGTGAPSPIESDDRGTPAAGHEIAFRAYTERSIVRATYELRDDRLTDALNRERVLLLTDVEFMTLHEPVVATRPQFELTTASILIAEATGPRGNERRRFRSSPRAVTVKLGPYRVQGFIHTVRGGHPILGLYHRNTMIPMTDVEVAYDVLGRRIVDRYAAAIMNREAITNIRMAGDESVA